MEVQQNWFEAVKRADQRGTLPDPADLPDLNALNVGGGPFASCKASVCFHIVAAFANDGHAIPSPSLSGGEFSNHSGRTTTVAIDVVDDVYDHSFTRGEGGCHSNPLEIGRRLSVMRGRNLEL
jgi:hypothetical protein